MDYLLEIGTEEVPARLVGGLVTSLHDGIRKSLEEEGLAPADGRWYATPRRMTVLLEGLPEGQPDRTEQMLGPPAKAAFDADGNPTKAAQGFARSKGAGPGDLQRVTTEKGEYAAVTVEVKGRATAQVLGEAVVRVVESMYLPVSMRWGGGHGPFVRAVRWIVSILDDQVLPVELFGVAAGRETHGHRVLGRGPHALERAGDYVETLRESGCVEPDPERRRGTISEGLDRLAGEAGGKLGEGSEDLLEELVMLLEHPVVVRGEFGKRYLALPKEILDTSMRYHQKMFSLEGADGRLLPSFLTVVNNEDPEGLIARGEAQVLDARLQDAVFFWEKDCERGLAGYAGELPRVVFQERLGSYADKVERMREVAPALGEMPGLAEALDHCKADLCTLTVGEFPELQGIVGGLLARAGEMPEEVAAAIRGQYDPLSTEEPLTHALALLDNLDTLVGCNGIGLQASGSKDPFGLRRAAYTLARILAGGTAAGEAEVGVLLDAARRSFRAVEEFRGDDATAHSYDLLKARLRFHLQEDLGFPYDETNAVLEAWWEKPADAVSRLRAVNEMRGAGSLEGLSEPLKRARNILKKAGMDEVPPLREDLLGDGAERNLFGLVEQVEDDAAPLLARGSYREALEKMADLRPAVNRFFEEVLVMDEDPAIRANRLSLLERVRSLFLKVADLGEIIEPDTRTEDQQ